MEKIVKTSLVIFLFLLDTSGDCLRAQDSTLLDMLNDSMTSGESSTSVQGTFNGIHIINARTVEAPAAGNLNFMIMHRFGKLNDGVYHFFGLDNASIRLGLDYGVTSKLSVGIGRSSHDKVYDGYIKMKLVEQTAGKHRIPVTICITASAATYTLRYPDKPYLNAKYRTSYVMQIPIASKLNARLSLQLSPVWTHMNLVPTIHDKNDIFALMAGGRLKITRRFSLIGEYNYVFPEQVNSFQIENSLSAGLEIETGGHVFQLVFSNSQGMTEPQYITRTTGSWTKGDVYFGFNVSRNFTLRKTNQSKTE